MHRGVDRARAMVPLLVVALLATSCIFQGAWQPATPGTPPQIPQLGAADEVDCTGPTWCFAAGGVVSGAAAEWDGNAWRPAPAPPEKVHDLDCPAVDSCVAVGQSGVHTWDGSGWTTPTWPAGTVPTALSCPTTSWCAIAAKVGTTPIVLAWNGTTTTDLQVTGAPTTITDVACLSSVWCMVVGALGGQAWAARRTWTTWTSWSVAGATSFGSVGCASAFGCRAGVDPGTTVGTWSAASGGWSLSTPLPGSIATGVECAPGVCVLVGKATAPGGHVGYQVQGLDGTPLVAPKAMGAFRDVACTSAAHCVIVEDDDAIHRWNGTTWADDPLDLGAIHGEVSDDIACSPSASCLVTGRGDRRPVVLRTDGTTSTVVDVGFAPSSTAFRPRSATECPSTDWCVVASASLEDPVGASSLDVDVDLVTGTDAAWAHAPISLGSVPRGATVTVEISCTAATWCLAAVGSETTTWALRWDGTEWSPLPDVTDPAGPPAALDCASPAACTLVTTPLDPGSGTASRVHRFDGTAFGPSVPAPAPAGGVPRLHGASCLPDGSCFAVGSATSGTAAGAAPWAIHISGDGTLAPSPLPADFSPGELRAISCTDIGECLAVGDLTSGLPDLGIPLEQRPAALGWRDQWMLLGEALPTAADGSTSWDAVSCTGQQCTVAGTNDLSAGGTRVDVARFTWPA